MQRSKGSVFRLPCTPNWHHPHLRGQKIMTSEKERTFLTEHRLEAIAVDLALSVSKF